MLNQKTVFVLGAGASVEVGLPTGPELTQRIAAMLDFRWELNQRVHGDELIAEALQHRSSARSEGQWDITNEVNAARRIAGAMAEALSIDNYMEAHSHDSNVMLVGKLAIARAISLAERKSALWLDLRTGEDFTPSKTKDTWFHSFWQLLHQGVTSKDVRKVFENLTVISFNYDRCLQQRLFFGLQSYYGLDQASALDVLSSLNIQYPYGSLGHYKGPASFGGNYDARQLLEVSNGIKTFSERIDDDECLAAIHSAIAEAQRVVLLGFAFHPQNITLMTPTERGQPKTFYATAFGIPVSNIGPIRDLLNRVATFETTPVIDFSKCNEFFRNQWYHLSQ
jgi:hypothetical protein